jgi:nucleoside phosphorylase
LGHSGEAIGENGSVTTVVLFPTELEARGFRRSGVVPLVSGVGLVATARSTVAAIAGGAPFGDTGAPDWLILAGLAGCYPESGLDIGDAALVAREVEADLGVFGPAGFVHLSQADLGFPTDAGRPLDCPHLPPGLPLPAVASATVSGAQAPHIDTDGLALENMEGAAFFDVCLAAGQRFLELRAISNVAHPHADWHIERGIAGLHAGLHLLLDHLTPPGVG